MRNEANHVAASLPAEVRVRLYDQALGSARIGAWECELATERLTWTTGVYDIFGYPVGNPLRRSSIVDLYVDESRRNMELARAEVIRTGRPASVDVEIRTWRSERRWMRLAIHAAGGERADARCASSAPSRTLPPIGWHWRACGNGPRPIR